MSTENQGSVKVIELVGESSESWEAAAQQALDDASQTLEGISGIKIMSQTAKVENNEIIQYRTTVHISFPIQR